MNSYATVFKNKHKEGSLLSHVDFHVSFFADNCITRIYSCRDKLALMVWSYYCPFNPEKKDEVLNYLPIFKRLKKPVIFGMSIKHQDKFLYHLEHLKGNDFFFVESYRHFKIHRREPGIEIYGVKPHHDLDYIIPLFDSNDINLFEKKLEELYPDQHFREIIKKGCYIKGVLFDQRKIKDRLFSLLIGFVIIPNTQEYPHNTHNTCEKTAMKQKSLFKRNSLPFYFHPT